MNAQSPGRPEGQPEKRSGHVDDFSAPHRRIWAIAGPAILANSSAPIVGLVDTWAIGHLPGAAYLAAVGIGSAIFSYILWAFGFLRMGTTGIVAQAHGRGDTDHVIGTALRASVLALTFGIGMLILQEAILFLSLKALVPPAGARAMTAEYFHIRIWAAPATLLLYAISGVLFGLARVRAVLVLQLILNVLNGILNVTFVVGLDMGVPGVALGTLIAAWVAALAGVYLVLVTLGVRDVLHHARAVLTWRLGRFRKLVTVNGFIFVRTLFLMAGLALIMRKSALMGEAETATSHVMMLYMLLISVGLDGFAHAAEALAGAAYGDGRRTVFRRWARLTNLWAIFASLVYAGIFWVGGAAITAMLTDIADIRLMVAGLLPLIVALPVIAVWSYQFDGFYIGATAGAPMMVTMAIAFAVFLAVSGPMTDQWGLAGLWGAYLIFLAMRGLTQALWMPRIEAKLAP